MTTTPTRCVVLPDTNVIVAASVYADSDVFGIVAAEPHHDESKLLLEAFLSPDSDSRCVLSPTVVGEVLRVARRAATQAVRKAFVEQRTKKSHEMFDEANRMVEKCVRQSIRFLSSMTKYHPRPSLLEAQLVEVDKITEDIRKRYGDITSKLAVCPTRGVPSSLAGATGFVRGDLTQ